MFWSTSCFKSVKGVLLRKILVKKMKEDKKIVTVAACDDEKYILEKLERDCQDYFSDKGLAVQIITASSGENLIDLCVDKKIDLAFLDIEMPEMSGFETAECLRLCTQAERVVFVTNREDLVYESFDHKPFKFVRKSRWTEEILHALERFYKELVRSEEKITVHIRKNEPVDMAVSDICYFEIIGHTLFIYKKEGTIKIREAMHSMEERLKEYYFIRIHKGYLVNPKYIRRFEENDCVLVNGTRLPVSRYKKDATRKRYMEYIRKCG